MHTTTDWGSPKHIAKTKSLNVSPAKLHLVAKRSSVERDDSSQMLPIQSEQAAEDLPGKQEKLLKCRCAKVVETTQEVSML